MSNQPISIQQKFQEFSEQWSPKTIAQVNDYHVRIARVEGDFTWHSHEDTDEVFLVIEGELRIDMENASVTLREGELFVVPHGIEHKPYAAEECKILLLEPAHTVNTGNSDNDQPVE